MKIQLAQPLLQPRIADVVGFPLADHRPEGLDDHAVLRQHIGQQREVLVEGGIALCDAGTGIGKTYAYLVAGTVYSRFRAACGLERKPILVSTSSIALQTAARDALPRWMASASSRLWLQIWKR